MDSHILSSVVISILVFHRAIVSAQISHFPVLPFADGKSQLSQGLPSSRWPSMSQTSAANQPMTSNQLLSQPSQEQKINPLSSNSNPIDDDYDEELMEPISTEASAKVTNSIVQMLMGTSSKVDITPTTVSPDLKITITVEPSKVSTVDTLSVNPISIKSEDIKSVITSKAPEVQTISPKLETSSPGSLPSLLSIPSAPKLEAKPLVGTDSLKVTTLDPEDCENNHTEEAWTVKPVIDADHQVIDDHVKEAEPADGKIQPFSNPDLGGLDKEPVSSVSPALAKPDNLPSINPVDSKKTDTIPTKESILKSGSIEEPTVQTPDHPGQNVNAEILPDSKHHDNVELPANTKPIELAGKPDQVQINTVPPLIDSSIPPKPIESIPLPVESTGGAPDVRATDPLLPVANKAESDRPVPAIGGPVTEQNPIDHGQEPVNKLTGEPVSDHNLQAVDGSGKIVPDAKPQDTLLQNGHAQDPEHPEPHPIDTHEEESEPQPLDYDNIDEQELDGNKLAPEAKPSDTLLPIATTPSSIPVQQPIDNKLVTESPEHTPELEHGQNKIDEPLHEESKLSDPLLTGSVPDSDHPVQKPVEVVPDHDLKQSEPVPTEEKLPGYQPPVQEPIVGSKPTVRHEEPVIDKAPDNVPAQPNPLVPDTSKDVQGEFGQPDRDGIQTSEPQKLANGSNADIPVHSEPRIEPHIPPQTDPTSSVPVQSILNEKPVSAEEEKLTIEGAKDELIDLVNKFPETREFQGLVDEFVSDGKDMFKKYLQKAVKSLLPEGKGHDSSPTHYSVGDKHDQDDDQDDDDDHDKAKDIHPVATVVINESHDKKNVQDQMREALKQIKDNSLQSSDPRLPKSSDSTIPQVIMIDNPKHLDHNEPVALSHHGDVGDHLASIQDHMDRAALHPVISDMNIKPIHIPQIMNQGVPRYNTHSQLPRYYPNQSPVYAVPSSNRLNYIGSVPIGGHPMPEYHNPSPVYRIPIRNAPKPMSMYISRQPAYSSPLMVQRPPMRRYPSYTLSGGEGSVKPRVNYREPAIMLDHLGQHHMIPSQRPPRINSNRWTPYPQNVNLQPNYMRPDSMRGRNPLHMKPGRIPSSNVMVDPRFKMHNHHRGSSPIYSSDGRQYLNNIGSQNSIYNPSLKTNAKQLIRQLLGPNASTRNMAQIQAISNDINKRNAVPVTSSPSQAVPLPSNSVPNNINQKPNTIPQSLVGEPLPKSSVPLTSQVVSPSGTPSMASNPGNVAPKPVPNTITDKAISNPTILNEKPIASPPLKTVV